MYCSSPGVRTGGLGVSVYPRSVRCSLGTGQNEALPMRVDVRGRPKPVKRSEKLRKPGGFRASGLEFWVGVLVERVTDGIRQYILTMVGPLSRMAFAVTLQEQFVEYREELLFEDLEGFNRRLAEWFIGYNTVLRHYSLGLESPVRSSSRGIPTAKGYNQYTGLTPYGSA